MVPGWGEREVVVGGWQGGGKGGEACQLCQGSSRREGEPCWDGGEEGLDDVVVRLCEGEVGVVVGPGGGGGHLYVGPVQDHSFQHNIISLL